MNAVTKLIDAMADHALESTDYRQPLTLLINSRIKTKTILDSFPADERQYFNCSECLDRISRLFGLYQVVDGMPVSIWRSMELETPYRGFIDMLIKETESLAVKGGRYLTHKTLMGLERKVNTQEIGVFNALYWEGYVQLGRSEHHGYPHFYLMLTPSMLPELEDLDPQMHRYFGKIAKAIKTQKLSHEKVEELVSSLGVACFPDVGRYSAAGISALVLAVSETMGLYRKTDTHNTKANFYSRLHKIVSDDSKHVIVDHMRSRKCNSVLIDILEGAKPGIALDEIIKDPIFANVNDDEMQIYIDYVTAIKRHEVRILLGDLEISSSLNFRNATLEDLLDVEWTEEESEPILPPFNADTFRDTMRKMKVERFLEDPIVQDATYIEFVGFDHLGEIRRFWGFSTLLSTKDADPVKQAFWHDDAKALNSNLFTTADPTLKRWFDGTIPIKAFIEAPWRRLKTMGLDIAYHYLVTDHVTLPHNIDLPVGANVVYRSELVPYYGQLEELQTLDVSEAPQMLAMPLTEHMAFRVLSSDGTIHHVTIKDID